MKFLMPKSLADHALSSGNRSWLPAVALVLILAFAAVRINSQAQREERQPAWGTGDSPTASTVQFETSAGNIAAAKSFSNAQYGTGGVGLRNRETASIAISGVLTPVKAAFIYWAVITEGAAPTADKSIMVQRLFPTPASSVITVTGSVVGTGPQPCWIGNTITVFKGSVATTVATGNGLYQVTLLSGASGSTDGGDPWIETPTLPLMEGASIVIVGTASSGSPEVAIYDNGLGGKTFMGKPGFSYSLTLPKAATGLLTLFDNIGADGQQGVSRTAKPGLADEFTVINGVSVAGPGSIATDSDWNGSASLPLPQLWDDTGHDITAATPSGTTILNVSIANLGESTFDCLTPVANVVQVQ